MTSEKDIRFDTPAALRTKQSELVPAPAAHFKGSFAPDGRKVVQINQKKPSLRNAVWSYLTHGWTFLPIWKSAFIEMMATMSLCYLSALIDITLANFQTAQISAYVGITNIFLLSLFIYACSPSSGGHLNPTITFATMTTGLIEFPRAVLYLCGQTIGGAIAGGLIRGSVGIAMTEKLISSMKIFQMRRADIAGRYRGGGCFRDTEAISIGQAFLIEAISSFILLYVELGKKT